MPRQTDLASKEQSNDPPKNWYGIALKIVSIIYKAIRTKPISTEPNGTKHTGTKPTTGFSIPPTAGQR